MSFTLVAYVIVVQFPAKNQLKNLSAGAPAQNSYHQWRKFTFFGGPGGKPPKFPTKLSNFRQTPLFALEKAVFSPLLGQNFRKFIIFREGGGGGRSQPPAPPRFPPLVTMPVLINQELVKTKEVAELKKFWSCS